jgi:transcriptional regulator with PAS, ATPase and Fis domain
MSKAVKENSSLLNNLGSLGWTILDSSPEGILISDKDGNIIYANDSHNEICKYDGSKRIGSNIFETNPDGALNQALKSGKPVFGKRHRPRGSQYDVISHAYPIYLNNRLEGAIVFFRRATDVLNLLEHLKKAQESLTILSSKINDMGYAPHTFSSIIGNSNRLQDAISIAKRVAKTSSTVLIKGETGTGKELFASAIHNESRRSNKPFIHVNCAAIPDSLLESEFFGFEKGSFTGATRRKVGTFELADEGTIFLDEIGDMDLKLQSKLLQVLQSGEFRRLGGTSAVNVDVRVIAATNRNLEKLAKEGMFRYDLYFRLNVVEIVVPPLRERKEDIPFLADHLLAKIGRKVGRKAAGIAKEALSKLQNYCWPGNVRELENVLERALILSEEGKPVPPVNIFLPSLTSVEYTEKRSIEEVEQLMIKNALNKFGTSVEGKKKAAEELGISLTTLYNKVRKLKDIYL